MDGWYVHTRGSSFQTTNTRSPIKQLNTLAHSHDRVGKVVGVSHPSSLATARPDPLTVHSFDSLQHPRRPLSLPLRRRWLHRRARTPSASLLSLQPTHHDVTTREQWLRRHTLSAGSTGGALTPATDHQHRAPAWRRALRGSQTATACSPCCSRSLDWRSPRSWL